MYEGDDSSFWSSFTVRLHPTLKPGKSSREKFMLMSLIIKCVTRTFDNLQLLGTRSRLKILICSIRHYLGMSPGNDQKGRLNFLQIASDVQPSEPLQTCVYP